MKALPNSVPAAQNPGGEFCAARNFSQKLQRRSPFMETLPNFTPTVQNPGGEFWTVNTSAETSKDALKCARSPTQPTSIPQRPTPNPQLVRTERHFYLIRDMNSLVCDGSCFMRTRQ